MNSVRQLDRWDFKSEFSQILHRKLQFELFSACQSIRDYSVSFEEKAAVSTYFRQRGPGFNNDKTGSYCKLVNNLQLQRGCCIICSFSDLDSISSFKEVQQTTLKTALDCF